MDCCSMCDNTGIFLQPNDQELFDKAFDRYDDMGIFGMDETRKKALEEVGYSRISPCPHCHKSPEDYAREKENK